MKLLYAEIITLRAIALKLNRITRRRKINVIAEIITLRAIALKPYAANSHTCAAESRDHNATSYSTETLTFALRLITHLLSRDHNATSYSTETNKTIRNKEEESFAEIITLRAIALKRVSRRFFCSNFDAEIITLRAIALKLKRFPTRLRDE